MRARVAKYHPTPLFHTVSEGEFSEVRQMCCARSRASWVNVLVIQATKFIADSSPEGKLLSYASHQGRPEVQEKSMKRMLAALKAHWARKWRVKRSRLWLVKALCVAAVVLFAPQVAWASAYGAGSLVRVSGTSPFAGSHCSLAGQRGENLLNSEVEPFVDVSPANADNIIGVWQQDRWSSGASRGNVVGASLDDGRTWKVIKQTKNSLCTGGTPANGGGYERSSDPWVTISPNGDAYLMSLSVDQDPNALGDFNPEGKLGGSARHLQPGRLRADLRQSDRGASAGRAHQHLHPHPERPQAGCSPFQRDRHALRGQRPDVVWPHPVREDGQPRRGRPRRR